MTLAQSLYEAGDMPAAIATLESASKLVPAANGQQNPNALIAVIATKQGDNARAIRALEAVVKVDSSDVEAARRRAGLGAPRGGEARTPAAN